MWPPSAKGTPRRQSHLYVDSAVRLRSCDRHRRRHAAVPASLTEAVGTTPVRASGAAGRSDAARRPMCDLAGRAAAGSGLLIARFDACSMHLTPALGRLRGHTRSPRRRPTEWINRGRRQRRRRRSRPRRLSVRPWMPVGASRLRDRLGRPGVAAFVFMPRSRPCTADRPMVHAYEGRGTSTAHKPQSTQTPR